MDPVKIWLTSVNPFLPQILPQTGPPPVDFSVGDIRRQIAAEWLEIAQWSQSRAYRKPPSLFRMVPSLTPYDLSFLQIGVPNAPTNSRRVLPPGEHDRRYRQHFLCIFTARCTLVQSAVLRSHVVCLSVWNVGGLWSHRLVFFENNFTVS